MKKSIKWIILIFLITFLLLFSRSFSPYYFGHDTLFHGGNIIYLSKTISLTKIFGDNIIDTSFCEYGYGTWLFYPKIPHLFAAYLYKIFKNIYVSMKLVYLITTTTSGIAMFLLSNKIFKNKKIAFLSSVIYLTYSYHLCEIYVRDAFAENFMFTIIPLIFLGLFELKDKNYKKFYIYFMIGYIVGIYSHLISMIFCTIFVALFILFYRKIFFKKDKLKALLISTIIVTCIVLPFLTTILEHKLLGNYIVFTDTFSNVYSTTMNRLKIEYYFNHNKEAITNNILVYINYTVIILLIVTTIIYAQKKNKEEFKDERKLLFFGLLICISFINSKWIWSNIPSFLSTIQFPWRLMTFFCAIISLYAPLCFLKFKWKLEKKVLYIIVISINILEGFHNVCFYGQEEFSTNRLLNDYGVMGWQYEYLPKKIFDYNANIDYYEENFFSLPTIIKTKNEDANLKILKKTNKKEIIEIQRKKTTKNINISELNKINRGSIIVSNHNNKMYVELPKIYYLGYKLTNKDNDNIKLYETERGMLGATLTKEGIYEISYTGTIYDQISNLIRKLCIIIIIIYEVKKHEKNSHTNSMLQRRKNNC